MGIDAVGIQKQMMNYYINFFVHLHKNSTNKIANYAALATILHMTHISHLFHLSIHFLPTNKNFVNALDKLSYQLVYGLYNRLLSSVSKVAVHLVHGSLSCCRYRIDYTENSNHFVYGLFEYFS